MIIIIIIIIIVIIIRSLKCYLRGGRGGGVEGETE